MLLRPYEPDKIPVVMVHGLASSPLAWIPMLNELLRDPKIHERYRLIVDTIKPWYADQMGRV